MLCSTFLCVILEYFLWSPVIGSQFSVFQYHKFLDGSTSQKVPTQAEPRFNTKLERGREYLVTSDEDCEEVKSASKVGIQKGFFRISVTLQITGTREPKMFLKCSLIRKS